MSSFKQTVSQAIVNTAVEKVIDTGLTVDGKAGWNIQGVRFLWHNAMQSVVPTADCFLTIQVNTETGDQEFMDKDSVFTTTMGVSGIAASVSAMWVQPEFQQALIIPRTTVQPSLYLRLSSNALAVQASVHIEIYYEVVKLSDLEVMRLMQGGA
jgi:hypothetical protein